MPVADMLRELLARLAGDPALLAAGPELPLFAGGAELDSLSGAILLTEIDNRFGVDVAAEDLNLDCLATLGTLTEFIAARIGEAQVGGAQCEKG